MFKKCVDADCKNVYPIFVTRFNIFTHIYNAIPFAEHGAGHTILAPLGDFFNGEKK